MYTPSEPSFFSQKDVGRRIVLSMLVQSMSVFTLLALCSYTYELATQSGGLTGGGFPMPSRNGLGILGGYLAHFLMMRTFGTSAFLLPVFFFFLSLKLLLPKRIAFAKSGGTAIFMIVWLSVALGYFYPNTADMRWYRIPGGIVLSFSRQLKELIGGGVLLFLAFSLVAFVLVLFGLFYRRKTQNELMFTEEHPPKPGFIMPPYKVTRQDNHANFPHAELRSAYLSLQSPQESSANSVRVADFSSVSTPTRAGGESNEAPRVATPPHLTAPHHSQPSQWPHESSGSKESARHVGYSTAHLLRRDSQ